MPNLQRPAFYTVFMHCTYLGLRFPLEHEPSVNMPPQVAYLSLELNQPIVQLGLYRSWRIFQLWIEDTAENTWYLLIRGEKAFLSTVQSCLDKIPCLLFR